MPKHSSQEQVAFQPKPAVQLEGQNAFIAVPWGIRNLFSKSRVALVLHAWLETPTGVVFKPRFCVHTKTHPLNQNVSWGYDFFWCVPTWAWVLPNGVFIALRQAQSVYVKKSFVAQTLFSILLGNAPCLYWVPNQYGNQHSLQVWLGAIGKYESSNLQNGNQSPWRVRWQNWLSLLGKGGA